jgi:hypothetical protein
VLAAEPRDAEALGHRSVARASRQRIDCGFLGLESSHDSGSKLMSAIGVRDRASAWLVDSPKSERTERPVPQQLTCSHGKGMIARRMAPRMPSRLAILL